ncbi:MAG: tRNA lysidine(34) synthetase TilS [Lewinellaceae bacterium]|nr:tRNA lysidine(34) synthetase TilS [Lewinellaceae bacterium]
MDLPALFKDFIKQQKLLPDSGAPVLLAVSGGLDSVVMAQLFAEAGHPFAVAHCNFGLRGGESDGDEAFVQSLAEVLSAPFFSRRFDTKSFATAQHLSVQMAARQLRYEWFDKLCRENSYDTVATAHHLNDSIETALLNFVRGTGLAGIKGIPSTALLPGSAAIRLVRPLVFAAREELEAFARERNLQWREDSSNASDDYARNFLRHKVIPLLSELNPNLVATAGRNLQRFSDAYDNYRFLLNAYLGDASLRIDKRRLLRMPAPRQALTHLLKFNGFSGEQARQVMENIDRSGFELEAPTGWKLLVDRKEILLTPATAKEIPSAIKIHHDDLMVTLPEGGRLFITPADRNAGFPDGKDEIIADVDKLRFPLILRPWQPGDSFQPFGMGGRHQKLQDLFTNLKVSRLEKANTHVLVNGDGHIVWVLGYRPGELIRVTEQTKRVVRIRLLRSSA